MRTLIWQCCYIAILPNRDMCIHQHNGFWATSQGAHSLWHKHPLMPHVKTQRWFGRTCSTGEQKQRKPTTIDHQAQATVWRWASACMLNKHLSERWNPGNLEPLWTFQGQTLSYQAAKWFTGTVEILHMPGLGLHRSQSSSSPGSQQWCHACWRGPMFLRQWWVIHGVARVPIRRSHQSLRIAHRVMRRVGPCAERRTEGCAYGASDESTGFLLQLTWFISGITVYGAKWKCRKHIVKHYDYKPHCYLMYVYRFSVRCGKHK